MENKRPVKILVGVGVAAGALFVCAIVLAIIFFPALVPSLFPRASLNHFLKGITNESDLVPTYVTYGDLHIGDETVHVSEIHRKQKNSDGFQEILCVIDEEAYYVYTASTGAWTIASMDLETKEIQDHYAFSDAQSAYQSEHYEDYSERMGFYHDGKIVLSDHLSVLEYDIATGVIKQQAYDTYTFPKLPVYGECTDNVLTLHFEDSVETFTLEDMASNSKGIARIYELKDKKNWNGYSYLAGFLATNTTQVIGDRIYFMDGVMNYHGEPTAIILEYDREQNTWRYVTMCYVGADIARKCHIIPSE